VDLGQDSTLCDGQTLFLEATWTPNTSYEWQDGSPVGDFLVSNPGQVWVKLENACGEASDTTIIDYLSPPPVFSLGRDSLLCHGDEVLLESGLSQYDFLWSNGTSGPNLTVISPGGEYWLELSNRCGSSRDSIQYDYTGPPVVDLGQDETLCQGDTRLLDVTWTGATYAWGDGFSQPVRLVNESGVYSVVVSNQCGSDQSLVAYDYVPTPQPIDLGPDQRLCWGDTLQLVADQGPAFNYRWQNGDELPFFVVRQAGTYSLRIDNECGLETDEINITYLAPPTASLGNDTVVCTDRARLIHLDASIPQEATYLWQDGSTDPWYNVTEPGVYIVTLANDCGVASDSI
jgi:hypothetical protein